MKRQIQTLLRDQHFHSLVCDFLFPAPNIPDLSRCVLFQHNVESMIWRRHVKQARNPATRVYFKLQSSRMEAFERTICRRAGHIVAVSKTDCETMRHLFEVERLSSVSTGVDIAYFEPPPEAAKRPSISADLVFTGSMDWMPNIDAAHFFVAEILPYIRKELPNSRVIIAGRRPDSSVRNLAKRDSAITITGTVPDIRPYLWGSAVSVVPLRIGGGTRLKIFEAMAARLPVVSTSIGAEGLPLTKNRHIAIADDPERFARLCLDLLTDSERRREMAQRGFELVSSQFSWDAVTRDFQLALEAGPRPN